MRYMKLLVFVTVTFLFITLFMGCSQKPQTIEPPSSPPTTSPATVPTPTPTPTPETVPSSVPEPEPLPLTPAQLTMLSISEGDVFIMKSGGVSWEEAKAATLLEPGDILRTDYYSNAVITFFEGSSIELQAGSKVEIVMLDIADGAGSTTIRLNQEIGKTISRVVKLTDSASRYEIETPAGIAVVRGSRMLLKVYGSGKTSITNEEGDIWAIAQGVEVKIPEGRKCNIMPGWAPSLQRLPDDDDDGGYVPEPEAKIAINKTASPEFIYSGDEVTYNYTLTNPGDDPLSDIVVTDDQGLAVTFITGDSNGNSKLDPGETWFYTATANPTEDVINTGSATGTDSKGNTVSDNDTAEVSILPPVTMTVTSDTSTVVTYSSSGYASPGDLAKLSVVAPDWWELSYNFTPSGAQLIWESNMVQNPVSGDIVDFEKTFIIPGSPVCGILYITCDNGYEAYINGNGYPAGDPNAISAQLGSGWRTSNLSESFVNHSGWASVESWDITAYLQSGVNILEIGTANEQNESGIEDPNPAGLIFEIVISYEAESTSQE